MERLVFKTPNEIDYVGVDYYSSLVGDSIDPMQANPWTVSDPAIMLSSPSLVGSPPTISQIFYSGGVASTAYFLDSEIMSLLGRVLGASFKIFVRPYNFIQKIIYKQAEVTADYSMDWLPRLDPGDTILSSVWAASDSSIGIAAEAPVINQNGTSTTVWLSGGNIGQSYIVTNQIVTDYGRTLEYSFKNINCAI